MIDILHVGNAIDRFLEPVFEPAHHTLAAGIRGGRARRGCRTGPDGRERRRWRRAGSSWPATSTRRTPELPARLAQTFAAVHRVLLNKYYVDELYDAVFVRGAAIGGGKTLHAVDRYLVDGGDGEVRPGLGVNGIAWMTRDVIARLLELLGQVASWTARSTPPPSSSTT